MVNLLYTVREIFTDDNESYLKAHEKEHYLIPLYQRGYKWKKAEVIKLLDDINNFQPEGQKFYCLQNITLVPSEQPGAFNVVDGQQRLATLVLILSYLGKKELVRGKVRFPQNSIRSETNKFINHLITSDVEETISSSWNEFIDKYQEYDHQDIFYLYHAREAIFRWFENNVDNEVFAHKLLNNVRLIMNNISDESNEEKIFGNLNSKRVPLDGADLVRAILITRVAYEEGKREADIKNIVRVNERRVRIGWELDEINNWWSKVDVSSYFKRFISIRSDEISVGNKLFKEEKYPINNLLLLFAEKNGKDKLSLEFIEARNNNALELYKELIKLHSTLKDWYIDRDIYHYLGFLFAQSKLSFKEVWDIWSNISETRQEFKEKLKYKIKELVIDEDTSNNITDYSTNWYENELENLQKILILVDVIWSVNNNQPFLPVGAFVRSGYDIEHIFPQNPKDIEDKLAYIQFLNKHCLEIPDRSLEGDFKSKIDDPDFQKKVEDFIMTYTSQVKINSIGNLVLLDSKKNRSFGNNPYSIKRAALVEDINRGIFIRPHTLKVFVRYFNTVKDENEETLHWTDNDIESNAKAIENKLKTFLGL